MHNGLLFNHKEEWNLANCNKMDETGHNVKWNKPDTKGQVPHVLSHM